MLPGYQECFSRNIGLLTEAEQERLRFSRAAIAGLGGVGGTYAVTLARLGVGRFHISDFDSFEPANFNRQAGAGVRTLGRPKTEVVRELILDINPEAEVRVFEGGIRKENCGEFLEGADVVLDGLDFYALPARRILFPEAERLGLHVVTSGPLGMTATLHVFGPGGMSFEDYFDFASCRGKLEEQVAFAVGVGPELLHLGQIDLKRVDIARQKAPSIGTAIQLCGGIACSEALHILLKRRTPFLSPNYLQFDPVRLVLRKRRLWFGNRGPLQRLKRMLMIRKLRQPGSEGTE